MGANESSDYGERYRVVPSSQLARSRREEPDQFRVLRVEAERNEIQVGGTRLETRRVNVVSAAGGGGRLRLQQREHVEIRLQGQTARPGLEWRSPPRLALGGPDEDSDDDAGYACTYDDDGPGYMLQPWYRCRTCWGPGADESCFGCCSHCAQTCHRGHDVQKCGLSKGECDCGQYKHQAAVCTWHVTKRNHVKQPFYRCFDCFDEPRDGVVEGVCYQCWKICHRTHNTRYVGVLSAFCDCGLTSCQIKCTIPAPK